MSTVDEEQPKFNPRDQMVRENSMTMDYFIESRNLDKATAEMLRHYDKDGNGIFDHAEVVSIIIDLKRERSDNEELLTIHRLYKNLLCFAIVLCIVALSGMAALTYGVVALTTVTDVSSDGTLVIIGTDTPVATDSRAELHTLPMSDNGLYCVTWDEIDLMRMEVVSGKDVILNQLHLNGSEKMTTLSGGDITTNSNNERTCFTTPLGETECAISSDECEGQAVGRTLSDDERSQLGLPERRLQDAACLGCSQP